MVSRQRYGDDFRRVLIMNPANLTGSKRPGNSPRIKIHFSVFNHFFNIFFSFSLISL